MPPIFSHPVLAPFNNDYLNSSFHLESNEESNEFKIVNDDIYIIIRYVLECNTLKNFIIEDKAEYAALVTTTWTNFANLYPQKGKESTEDILVLPAGDLAGDIVVVPYILAKEDFKLMVTDDHNDDYKSLGNKNSMLDVDRGSILAIGDGVTIEGDNRSINSIFDIANSDEIKPGEFSIDYSEQRIIIKVSKDDREIVEKLRTGKIFGSYNVLFPSLFLHAVIGAIEILELGEDVDLEWQNVLLKQIEKNLFLENENLTLQDIQDEPLKYGQKLLKGPSLNMPLGNMLDGFRRYEREESES